MWCGAFFFLRRLPKKTMKQNYKILLIILLTAFGLSVFPMFVAAQPQCTGGKVYVEGKGCRCPEGQEEGSSGNCQLKNPAKGQLVDFRDFAELLTHFIQWLLYAAGAIAVVFLIIGGFQYIASRGNEEATERAKKTLTSAIIGIVVIVMAFAIVAIINTILTTSAP